MTTPLLTTKLYIPPVRPELVSRPRLIERLNAGLHCKLTLISAPAGFGKTTLVSEWVDHLRLDAANESQMANGIAWLSLDEGDNDPTRFLAYFVAALQTIEVRREPAGAIGKGALSALESPQPPPAEDVLTSLINEIAAIPDRIILVLDDYHLIEAQSIHDAIAFLLEHLPPQMHLVIATREDPHLSLARLRARGQLTELRATDLRFTSSEAAGFLNQVMDLNLSSEEIAALETRTEGWIAGLQMAALSMQGRADTASYIQAFTGSHHFVLDYLIEEVLEQQSESVQTFLLQTAVLNRLTGSLCDAVRFGTAETPSSSDGTAVLDRLTGSLCDAVRFGTAETPSSSKRTAILDGLSGSLCDAVRFGTAETPSSSKGTAITEQDNGQATLEMLERANLFIIPLDEERRWYRYHHLFSDLLRQRLRQTQPDWMPTLHHRASEWYEQNGSPADAVRHALAAEDFKRAASLAELAWPAWRGSLQSIEWLGWVKALPEELIRARPVLSVAYAQALLNAGKLEAAEARLLAAERWLEPATDMSDRPEDPAAGMVVVDEEQFRSLPVSLATARAYHAQATGDVSGTLKYTRRVLDLLPEGDHQWRGAASSLLGLAQYASGDLEAAHRTFSDGLAGMDPLDAMTGTFVLADIKVALGQLHAAESAYEQSLQLAMEHGEPMPVGTEDLYTGIGEIHRERGDLEAAAQDLLTSRKLGEQVELPDWQHRWCIAQSRFDVSMGNLGDAIDSLEEAARVYVRTPVPEIRPIAAMKARVWVKQGRLTEALAWTRERGLSVDDDLSYLREFEYVTLARVLIAEHRNDRIDRSILEAMGLLERLLRAAEEGGRTGSVIEILALQALAQEARGNMPPALVSLERALTLAEPEGYIRLFVDEGQPMAHLLHEAFSRGVAPDYIRQLLAAFPSTDPEQTDSLRTQDPQSELFEPLSGRELEVLQLIAEGLTNPEIAARLFLSPHTVKAHTRNIYGKLDVHSRTQAVARSHRLGLLPRG